MTPKAIRISSSIILTLTLISFVTALQSKGITEELFLEVGVFLVSAKLIVMSTIQHHQQDRFKKRLDTMDDKLDRILQQHSIAD